ncbi:MAG: hypothetical protein KBG15_13195 [Kofleriaceae bacterium]|nr:hypothetical protein [Kofleriaceae bacterium]
MKTPRITTAALLIALGSFAACAADAPVGNGPGGDNPGGDNPGDDDVKVLKLAGKYGLSSKFDMQANMPGAVGEVARMFIDMTDDSTDPGQFIAEQVVAAMPSGAVRTALNAALPFVSGYLNDYLLQIAPDFVTKIVKIGNVFGDASKNFGTLSELSVTGSTSPYVGSHTVNGVEFKIDGNQIPFMFADYGMTNVNVANLAVGLEQAGKMTISDHKLPLQYGAVLRIALDEAIIPLVDPNAANLTELLQSLVDCQAVGQAVANQIGFGAGTAEVACNAGLALAANKIYDKLAEMDGSALEFQVAGTAKAVDSNADQTADRIDRGGWTGTVSYAGTPAPLANAIFAGSKM